jgi:hypothetical protein
MLQIRADEDPYIDRYSDPVDDARGWLAGGWLGLVSLLSHVVFRVMPWVRRHRWCPRCRRTVA